MYLWGDSWDRVGLPEMSDDPSPPSAHSPAPAPSTLPPPAPTALAAWIQGSDKAQGLEGEAEPDASMKQRVEALGHLHWGAEQRGPRAWRERPG